MKRLKINYRKLKNSRKKRKLSLDEVSKNTGIPTRTLQKYETGEIQKILEYQLELCRSMKQEK